MTRAQHDLIVSTAKQKGEWKPISLQGDLFLTSVTYHDRDVSMRRYAAWECLLIVVGEKVYTHTLLSGRDWGGHRDVGK